MIIRKEDQPVAVKEKVQQGQGQVHFRYFLEEKDACGAGRLFAVITLREGESIGPHPHEGEYELYYILSGEASVLDNGEPYTLLPGDMMQCKNGDSHAVENRRKEDLVFIAIILKDQTA